MATCHRAGEVRKVEAEDQLTAGARDRRVRPLASLSSCCGRRGVCIFARVGKQRIQRGRATVHNASPPRVRRTHAATALPGGGAGGTPTVWKSVFWEKNEKKIKTATINTVKAFFFYSRPFSRTGEFLFSLINPLANACL